MEYFISIFRIVWTFYIEFVAGAMEPDTSGYCSMNVGTDAVMRARITLILTMVTAWTDSCPVVTELNIYPKTNTSTPRQTKQTF